MDCVGAAIFVAGAIWFCLAAAARAGRPTSHDPFRQLARHYQGSFHGGVWTGRRMVRFSQADAETTVRQESRRGVGRVTDVWLPWPVPQLTMHIAPALRPLPSRAIQGLQRLDSANDPFFWRQRVFASDPSEAWRLLNESVKWQVEQLRQYLPRYDVEVRIDRGRLLVRKHGWLRDYERLERFVDLTLRFYEQALLTQEAGIEFVESATCRPAQEVRCQVCGEAITTDMVICRRCKTPHHRECWEYTGACSVYGCQETEYFTPRLLEPPHP